MSVTFSAFQDYYRGELCDFVEARLNNFVYCIRGTLMQENNGFALIKRGSQFKVFGRLSETNWKTISSAAFIIDDLHRASALKLYNCFLIYELEGESYIAEPKSGGKKKIINDFGTQFHAKSNAGNCYLFYEDNVVLINAIPDHPYNLIKPIRSAFTKRRIRSLPDHFLCRYATKKDLQIIWILRKFGFKKDLIRLILSFFH